MSKDDMETVCLMEARIKMIINSLTEVTDVIKMFPDVHWGITEVSGLMHVIEMCKIGNKSVEIYINEYDEIILKVL